MIRIKLIQFRLSGMQPSSGNKDWQQNSSQPTDWLCEICNGQNFSRRVDCFKCKAPKGTAATMNAQHSDINRLPQPQKVDGLCEFCNVQNFSRRVECFKCKAPKSDRSILVSISGEPVRAYILSDHRVLHSTRLTTNASSWWTV